MVDKKDNFILNNAEVEQGTIWNGDLELSEGQI